MLGPWTQMEHRNKLGAGVDGQPEPQDLLGIAQPGAQFIQLEVRELEMGEGALVQGLRVLTCAPEPGGDGGVSKAEDPFGRGRVQLFGQRREYHGDRAREGVFRRYRGVLRRAREGGAAGRPSKGLVPLSLPMLAIADQCVNVSIGDAEVGARLIGTGIAVGVDPLGRAGGFWPRTRDAPAESPALHPTRVWRRNNKQDSRLGSAAMPQTREPAAFDGRGP